MDSNLTRQPTSPGEVTKSLRRKSAPQKERCSTDSHRAPVRSNFFYKVQKKESIASPALKRTLKHPVISLALARGPVVSRLIKTGSFEPRRQKAYTTVTTSCLNWPSALNCSLAQGCNTAAGSHSNRSSPSPNRTRHTEFNTPLMKRIKEFLDVVSPDNYLVSRVCSSCCCYSTPLKPGDIEAN